MLISGALVGALQNFSVSAETITETVTSGEYTYQGDTYLSGKPSIELGDNNDPLNITVNDGDLYINGTMPQYNIGKSNNITITADNVYFENTGILSPDTRTSVTFNAIKLYLMVAPPVLGYSQVVIKTLLSMALWNLPEIIRKCLFLRIQEERTNLKTLVALKT